MRNLVMERYKRFLARSPRLEDKYPLSFYIGLGVRCSILKTVWYSARFRGAVVVGRGTRIRVHRSAHIALAPKSLLAIGMAYDTPAGAVLRMHPQSLLRIEGRVQVMRACTITVGSDATLTIGSDTYLNDGAEVWCNSPNTTIGPECAIAWGVRILDTDFHKLLKNGSANPRAPSPHAPVHIGRKCWIGANALVLKGVSIGEGSVVAAGAVVTSEVPPHSLVAGVPATVVRKDVTWTL
jgi:acetyltransferase-like isoleucine patch superfamily enzyme